MSLIQIAFRYLTNRPLVTLLTVFGVLLGAALISSVLTLRRETHRIFVEQSNAFDMIVGAKGSPLQLTLSSLYHMDIPTGNIPYARYLKLKNDPRISTAIPLGLGDNYEGFRIVGTDSKIFEYHLREYDEPWLPLRQGRFFKESFEVVIGHRVAQTTGLKIDDTFLGTHGLVALAGSEVHRDFPYRVVGILNPTGTAQDRAIFCRLDSVWKVHEKEEALHAKMFGSQASDSEISQEANSETSNSELESSNDLSTLVGFNSDVGQKALDLDLSKPHKEVTAVLLQLKSPALRYALDEEIRDQTESMAAIPIFEMHRLNQQLLKPMQTALLAIAAIVVFIAGLSILATLIQAAERRRRDIAVMRALGARRWEIFTILMCEALFLTIAGVGLGAGLGHFSLGLAANWLPGQLSDSVHQWSIDLNEIKALLAVILLGWITGLLPAVLSYNRSPVKDLNLN